MARYVIERSGFEDFLGALLKDYRVYAIVEEDGIARFKAVKAAHEPVLSLKPTHLSAREYLMPPRQLLMRFDLCAGTVEPVHDSPKQVLLGLHPCDIRAISLLDGVFNRAPADPHYLERRRNTIIIGGDCMPDEYCFCQSLGGMEVEEGFDLFFHSLSDGYLVRVGTEQGRKLLESHARCLKEAGSAEDKELKGLLMERKARFVRTLKADASSLPRIYERGYNHPVWDRIGALCYGCGSCNHVCPTCYCFDIKDETGLDLERAGRYRLWDGCTLEDFALIAGGHNFRKGRGERLRHRFNRKFNYQSRGSAAQAFCVGCGRCIRACLVGIDITAVTNELTEDGED